MIRTSIASGLAVLFVSAITSQPLEARGGFARTGSFHHSVVPTVRIVGHSTSAHMSFNRLNEPGFRRSEFFRHGKVGWALPFGYVGSYYDPSDGVGPGFYDNPVAAGVDSSFTPYQTMAVVGPPDRARACRSDAQWVPGAHGLTRVVVTRC